MTSYLDPVIGVNELSNRVFTSRLVILVTLALAAAANGGWKWNLPPH
jgi:hypothetical protein